MIVCGYSLDVYCDHVDCESARKAGFSKFGTEQFFGDTKREAFAAARLSGWKLDEKTDECRCPLHAARKAPP